MHTTQQRQLHLPLCCSSSLRLAVIADDVIFSSIVHSRFFYNCRTCCVQPPFLFFCTVPSLLSRHMQQNCSWCHYLYMTAVRLEIFTSIRSVSSLVSVISCCFFKLPLLCCHFFFSDSCYVPLLDETASWQMRWALGRPSSPSHSLKRSIMWALKGHFS